MFGETKLPLHVEIIEPTYHSMKIIQISLKILKAQYNGGVPENR